MSLDVNITNLVLGFTIKKCFPEIEAKLGSPPPEFNETDSKIICVNHQVSVEKIQELSKELHENSNMNCLKILPVDKKILTFSHYLNTAITIKVDQILKIDVENRNEIIRKYDLYREKISLVRYNSNQEQIQDVEEFILEIESYLKNLGIKDESGLKINKDILDFSRKVVNDVNISDATIDFFINKKLDLFANTFNYKMGVGDVRNIVVDFIGQIQKNCSYLFSKMLREIEGFKSTKNKLFQKDLSKKSSDLKEILREINKNINKINFKSSLEIIEKKKEIEDILLKVYSVFNSGEIIGGETSFGENSFIIDNLKEIREDIISKGKDLNDERIKYTIDGYRIKNRTYPFGKTFQFSREMGEWTFTQFDKFVQFQERCFVWHTMGDSYISHHLLELRQVFLPALKNWAQKTKNYKQLCLQADGLKEMSLDEVVKWIEDPSKKSNKPITKINNVFVKSQKELDSKPLEKPVLSGKPIKKPVWGLRSIQRITKILRSEENKVAEAGRAALANVIMHLEDLAIIKTWLGAKDSIESMTPSYLVNQTARSTFYVLEQLLRYCIIAKFKDVDVKSLGHHNLKGLLNRLNPTISQNSKIVDDLYHAYLWTCYTFMQGEGWKHFDEKNTPELLQMLIRLFEKPDSIKNDDLTQLEKYCEQTLDFVNETLLSEIKMDPNEEIKVEESLIESEYFIGKEGQQIDLKRFHNLSSICLKIEQKHGPDSDYSLQMMQVRKEIDTLVCSLQKLKGPVPSHEVSLLVRTSLYAQYRIFEELLQVTSQVTTGIAIYDQSILPHDLSTIYESIVWKKKPSFNALPFIKEHFVEFNSIYRYTSQCKNVKNPILEPIEKANLYRENPKKRDESILIDLTKFINQTMNIIEKQLVRELE